MKIHLKSALASLSALVIAGGITIATAGTAFAVTPGWEPDPNVIGTVTFTDATGAPITGGSTTAQPMAAFAVASHVGRSFDTKAFMDLCTPQSGVNSQLWNCDQLGASTAYSSALTPAAVYSLGFPVQAGTSTDESVATENTNFPNLLTTATYQNLYQVRIYTAGPGHTADLTQFDATDILVNPSAGTWTVAYPGSTVSSTTSLTTTPAGPNDVTSNNPESVTLNASVTPGAAVPSTYTGPIGTVTFFDGATTLGTKLVTGAGPYTASLVDPSVANPSSNSFTAVFSPYVGTTLTGSTSAPAILNVGPLLPNSTTTLSATWQPFAGGSTPTHFSGTVTGGTPPLTAGSVNLFDNGSTTPLNPTPLVLGAGGAFSADIIIVASGPHSVVATFTDAGVYNPSSSAPVTQTLGADPGALCTASPATGAGSCTDQQTITGTVPAGTLTVSTPYTAANPFNVGTLALDGTGTILTTHAVFGGAGLDPTNANADIIVTDTRAGDLNWTLQAQSSNLTDTTSYVINSQNVGLTGLGSHPAPGFNTAGLVGFDNPAANGVAVADPGTLGLGGTIKHDVAQATHGIGTVGIYGTLTLNAPTSTPAGIYKGTLTFTIVGSLV